MVRRSASLRYATSEKEVNKVDFISQGMELGDGERDLGWTCGGNEGDSFWKVDDDFGVDQDIDDEGEEVEEDEDGGEV
ncbi:hypothetical protein Tco_1294230 [Tanacetum coccineum]